MNQDLEVWEWLAWAVAPVQPAYGCVMSPNHLLSTVKPDVGGGELIVLAQVIAKSRVFA
jgi:hypothetical protein